MRHFVYFLMVLFLLMSTAVFSFADDTFDSFSNSLDSWAVGLKGVTESIENGKVRVNIDKTSGVIKGMAFNVIRPGEELIHPITGKSLGKKNIVLGQIEVTDVHDNYFLGIFSGDTQPVKGDMVSFTLPIGVKLIFDGLSDAEKTEAGFTILKSKIFVEAEESDFTILCTKKSSEQQNVSCDFIYKDSLSLISADIPVISVSIADVESPVGSFGEVFESAAVGFAQGRSKNLTVAAAENKVVHIFSYDSTVGFKKVATVDGDFYNIVNVEFADLNGNGIDELFISNVTKANKTESYIYEFSGKTFEPVAVKMPHLFRSFFSDGKKTIICQQFEDGDFNSRVAEYIYKDGKYQAGNAIDLGLGVRLYGFGVTSAGETSFDTGGGLLIKDSLGNVTRYGGYFGDTPHKLTYTVQELAVAETGADSGAITKMDERILSVAVYPRIIEIVRGKFVLAGNIPVIRKTVGDDEYRNSFYGIYTLIGGKAEPFWQILNIDPAIIETDIAVSDDVSYVLLLRKVKGGLFSGMDSEIKIVNINLK